MQPAHHDSPVGVDTLIEGAIGRYQEPQENLQEIFGLQKEPFVQRIYSITAQTP